MKSLWLLMVLLVVVVPSTVQDSLPELVRRIKPSAVAIETFDAHGAKLSRGSGFFIDVDHFVDYVLVERQRDLRPRTFLRYYLGGHVRKTVLALHSYELFALLGALAWWLDPLPLWGYLMGALMHLALDIIFNGEQTPRSIAAFYSFGYRLAYRFDSQALLGPMDDCTVPAPFWTAFFAGATVGSPVRPPRPARASVRPESGQPVA